MFCAGSRPTPPADCTDMLAGCYLDPLAGRKTFYVFACRVCGETPCIAAFIDARRVYTEHEQTHLCMRKQKMQMVA